MRMERERSHFLNKRCEFMENLLYSLNCVVPLFAVIGLGVLLRRLGVLNDGFVDAGTKLGFRVALPCLLFSQVLEADMTSAIDPKLCWFTIISVAIVTGLLCLVVPLFVKDRAACGALVQGIFRGNFAILGIPLAINMFGTEGAAPTALLLPITVPLYNILAVLVLSFFAPRDGSAKAPGIGKVLLGVVTNPLIIGIALAMPLSLLQVELPEMVSRTVDSVSSLATPVALLCLGAQFDWKNARQNLRLTLPAALVKQALIPSVMLAIAALFGFRGGELGALFIVFMAPSSVSSYIMAKNMKSDEQLAAQMILWTTLISLFTMFIGIYILRSLQLF